MTLYQPAAIYNFWVGAAGTASAGWVPVAVALAESGGTSQAVSPTSDYGLWQIHLPLHLGDGGITASNWWTPIVNARAAVTISANGTNWGPWCTCWATPENDCASGTLGSPQPGSAAYAQLQRLVGAPQATPPPPNPSQTPHEANLVAAWSRIQTDAGAHALTLQRRMIELVTRIRSA